MSSSPRKKVGAFALKEQLKELKQESVVLMELQNRLDKSIETLKMHKKHVIAQPSRATPSHSSPPPPLPLGQEGSHVLQQFINNLSEEPGVVHHNGMQSHSVPPSGPAPGVATLERSPLNQRRLYFDTEGLQYSGGGPVPYVYSTGYYRSGLAANYGSSAHKATSQATSYVDDDNLTTRTEYQRKLDANSVELEHATNRMAKQELEIYSLKQKCNQLERERRVATAGDGAHDLASASPATPPLPSKGEDHQQQAAAAVDTNLSGLEEDDSKILARWGFKSKPSSPFTTSKKKQRPRQDFTFPSTPPRSHQPAGSSSVSAASLRGGTGTTATGLGTGLGLGLSGSSPSTRPASASAMRRRSPLFTSSPDFAASKRLLANMPTSPSPRERYLESELIKRSREVNAMSSAFEDLDLDLAGGSKSSAMKRKSAREEQLEFEMRKKDEVISAMSSTLDELLLKTTVKDNREKNQRERELESEVKRKDEELLALTSALNQIQEQQHVHAVGSVSAKKEQQQQQQQQQQAHTTEEELKSLTSALNEVMMTSPLSRGSYPSPTNRTAASYQHSWTEVGSGQDPFAEIRAATEKLQHAQQVLGRSGATSSTSTKKALAAKPSSPRPAASKMKPKMYYV